MSSAHWRGKQAGNAGHGWESSYSNNPQYKADFERGKQEGLRKKRIRNEQDADYRKRTQSSSSPNAGHQDSGIPKSINTEPSEPMHWLLKTVLSGIGSMVIAIGVLNARIMPIFAALLVIGINIAMHFMDLKIEANAGQKYSSYRFLLFIAYVGIILYFIKAIFGRFL